jgi:SAM-dependent methyltransferase
MNKNLFEKYIRALPQYARVLDAGSGDCEITRYIHSLRPDLEIFDIDINLQLKEKAPEYARFFNMSVENLKFKKGYFDCILCFHVLEHLREPKIAINEFYKVLNKKGVIFAESPHWITTITPVGYNFYDDSTHIRPYNVKSYSSLFGHFSVKYASFEAPIFFYLPKLYNLETFSSGYMIRKLFNFFGLYNTSVFLIAKKE